MNNMENIYKSYNATERYMGNFLNEGETDDEYRLHQQAMDLFKEDIVLSSRSCDAFNCNSLHYFFSTAIARQL